MTGISFGLAATVWIVSLSFAFVMAIQMTILLLRRRRIELSATSRRADALTMSRELMAVISGKLTLDGAPTFAASSTNERLKMLTHLMHLVRGDDRAALLRIAERSGLLRRLIDDLASRRPAQRVDSMKILEQFSTPTNVEALLACMGSDRSLVVRNEAAAALARMGHLPDPAIVIDMLDLKQQPLTPLHQALFRASAPHAANQLATLARNDSLRTMRALLVEALGWSNGFARVEDLQGHTSDPDPHVRCAALRAARRLGHPGAAPWAFSLLIDPIDIVRIQAIQTCAKLGASDAIPILVSLLENPSWWVRMRARQAIETLRPQQPVRADITGMLQ